jgi:hypothetical protein
MVGEPHPTELPVCPEPSASAQNPVPTRQRVCAVRVTECRSARIAAYPILSLTTVGFFTIVLWQNNKGIQHVNSGLDVALRSGSMDQQLVAKFLTSDSDEIADIKANLKRLERFIELIQEIEGMPDNNKRFYEESRSLYQTTITKRNIADLENLLSNFFGAPVKHAGKPLPRKLRKSSVVKYLGGLEKDQSLFLTELKTGQFYGALWPWRRNKSKIEIHLGYCSDWMTDEDYQQLENLVHQCISDGAFERMDAGIGGQIHGISLPSFLQMAEMEKSSFTLRVTSRNRVGELHLNDGVLLAAQLDDLAGREAAYRIISWDDVSIDIEPLKASAQDEIKQPLMHVLMESLKLKDEATFPQEAPPQPKGRPAGKRRPAPSKSSKRLVRLERTPTPQVPLKRRSILSLIAIGFGAFAILAAIAVVYLNFMENQNSSEGYNDLIAQAEKTNNLENKLELLQKYLKKHHEPSYDAAIQSQIQDLQGQIEQRDFDKTTLAISALPLDEHYEEKAISLYGRFLDKYPNSNKRDQINKSVAEIKNLLDQYYYEELKRAARLNFNKRLATYRQYLDKFPDGTYKKDVQVLINEMGEKYVAYLEEEAKQCEQKRQWGPCIEHCDNFINAYTGLTLSKNALQLKNRLEDQRDYYQLHEKAEGGGNSVQETYDMYKAYLDQHPESTKRQAIEKEMAHLSHQIKDQQKWLNIQSYATNPANDVKQRIANVDRYLRANITGPYASEAQSLLARLEQERLDVQHNSQRQAKIQDEQARIQQLKEQQARQQLQILRLQADLESRLKASSRYHSNGDGTFKDLSTGLTWCLLDSYQELGGCVTFEAALKYVQNLQKGDHLAWRLPSASELASLYKQAPYFPQSGAKWYWSGETAVKGYHSVAQVVSSEHASVFHREQRPLSECGNVRAVLETTRQ